MKKTLLAASLIALASTALVGCGDKQPDCNSDAFSKSIVDQIGENLFSTNNDPQYKFTDKDDFIKRNHIELRNIKETSADDKNHTKVCSFDISIQPLAPMTSRFEVKNQSVAVSIDKDGKEVASTRSNYGYGMMDTMERVEMGKPSKEQQEAIDALKKQQEEQKNKDEAIKKEVTSVSLDQYKFISDEDLTWLYLARAENKSDKDMLSLTSAAYYNEQDEFKKKDIEKAEIPAMHEKLNNYKKIKYIKFVSVIGGKLNVKLDTLSGGPVMNNFLVGTMPSKYDFDKQVYPLTMNGCPTGMSSNGIAVNNQNVKVEWEKETALASCVIKPKDEAQAREWNEVFKAEEFVSGHDNYATIYLALKDGLNQHGLLDATLVRVDVNYNGAHPLKLQSE